jgi:hypothetical protein
LSWWGDFSIPHGQAGRWRIGPFLLTVRRERNEWQVVRSAVGDPASGEIVVEVPCEACGEPEAGSTVTRFGVSDRNESLSVTPALPDRSVVTRPEQTITVPSKQSTTVYVGSPLWVRLSAGQPLAPLCELPAMPPKLTWWGPSTIVGETCYATRTMGRLRLEDARAGPHRVMTAARIVNRASTPLVVERLNLPVRALSIYGTGRDSNRLWTESVTLERAEGEEFAALHVGKDPGPDVRGAEKVAAPRGPVPAHELFRAFGKLFR